MSELRPNLNQVLQAIDLLDSRDLAVIEGRLAVRKQLSEQIPPSAADLFEISFAEYLAMSAGERDAIALRAYLTLQTWIDAELEKREAEWMLVCGGKILETSPTIRDYPSREKLMQTGQQRDRIPFVFIRTPLIEESGWSALARSDFYPTIQLTIATLGTSQEEMQTSGVELTADFDSGSPSVFLDYDQMLAHQIVDEQPVDQAHYRPHLGQMYQLHILPLQIGVRSEDGTTKTREFSAMCVRDWRLSPLCHINPNREALAGRNLILDFPLRLELDGLRKTTRIAPV